MPELRPHLGLLAPAPDPVVMCPSRGCELPVSGAFGLCEPCERVYRCLLVLCDRLLSRDLARVEHRTPGLIEAARASVTEILTLDAANHIRSDSHAIASEAPWSALLPTPEDLYSVQDLLSELAAGIHALGTMTT